ncbi:EpsG-like putative glucosyltransferase [Kerstersia gyiorum]|uniref:EpsG-like putative glucosyltransferase n=1 Tax=Kerstersia gyiorum TaxID=206506 RepID=A0A4Q7MIU6_9BURK|nr:EpsG family protein [Kerstersia gyiorum]RZS67483.1 EpsG-like putative glucosyltransferase [Kerstersia gyiorum]
MINNSDYGRICIVFILSFFYVYAIYRFNFINPPPLESDYLQYFETYNYTTLYLDRFGVELILPILFYIFNSLGVEFFNFSFLLGIFWLIPIILLSKEVRSSYLIFYFLFFIFYFPANYAFLMRQYLCFYFFLLYLCCSGRLRFLFLFLSIFTHLSAIVFLIFCKTNIKNKEFFYFSFLAVFVIFLGNQLGLGFSSVLQFVVNLDIGIYDIQRKLSMLTRLGDENVFNDSILNYVILILSMFLHCVYLSAGGKNNNIMLLMFFSACIAVMFSDFKILANRFGFAAFFFSIPYFFIVLSRFSLNSSGKFFVRSN